MGVAGGAVAVVVLPVVVEEGDEDSAAVAREFLPAPVVISQGTVSPEVVPQLEVDFNRVLHFAHREAYRPEERPPPTLQVEVVALNRE